MSKGRASSRKEFRVRRSPPRARDLVESHVAERSVSREVVLRRFDLTRFIPPFFPGLGLAQPIACLRHSELSWESFGSPEACSDTSRYGEVRAEARSGRGWKSTSTEGQRIRSGFVTAPAEQFLMPNNPIARRMAALPRDSLSELQRGASLPTTPAVRSARRPNRGSYTPRIGGLATPAKEALRRSMDSRRASGS